VRLLALYSLVKPPRGSNISGGEMLHSLMTHRDNVKYRKSEEKKKSLEDLLDYIIDSNRPLDEIPKLIGDHDYFACDVTLNIYAISYVAGYVARRAKSWCNDCVACENTLSTSIPRLSTRFIELKNTGGLTYPSEQLENAVTKWEQSVQQALKQHSLSADFIFLLAEQVWFDTHQPPPHQKVDHHQSQKYLLGCDDQIHKKKLTKNILKFFLTTRLHFFCREACSNDKQRKLSKIAKFNLK
jgi:hypothetical protein